MEVYELENTPLVIVKLGPEETPLMQDMLGPTGWQKDLSVDMLWTSGGERSPMQGIKFLLRPSGLGIVETTL